MTDATATRLRGFTAGLGYVFSNAELLLEALTHSSFANESASGGRHNERLEFLGDAVLSLCVSRELFARFPHAREGDLTRMRSGLVNASSLAELARATNLDEHLLLGRGEESQGGRTRDTLLGDALEAVLGAVFEDGGFAAAQEVVGRLFTERWPGEPAQDARKDFKTRLQEVMQRQYRDRPIYTPLADHGPEHAKIFTVRLTLPDGRQFTAEGSSLKRAEQEAAKTALRSLRDRPEAP